MRRAASIAVVPAGIVTHGSIGAKGSTAVAMSSENVHVVLKKGEKKMCVTLN